MERIVLHAVERQSYQRFTILKHTIVSLIILTTHFSAVPETTPVLSYVLDLCNSGR